jgi:hypothetical protein
MAEYCSMPLQHRLCCSTVGIVGLEFIPENGGGAGIRSRERRVEG